MKARTSSDAGELIFFGNFARLNEIMTVHAVFFIFLLAVWSVFCCDSVNRVISKSVLWQHSFDISDISPSYIDLADHLATVVSTGAQIYRIVDKLLLETISSLQ